MDKLNYEAVMQRIDFLMNKGSENVSTADLVEIRELALAAQGYEQNKYTIDPPNTLIGMVEMKMYESKLKQIDLAKKLKISTAKLSLIMSGKQKADVAFLKGIYKVLHVDADFILNHV